MEKQFAKLVVRTSNGFTTHYYSYLEPWVFGKFLTKHFKNKEYQWEEVSAKNAEIITKVYNKNWKLISE